MISISFDVDWAPDGVLLDCLDLLSTVPKINATFFATHATKVLSGNQISEHEVGIHPNLMPNFQGKGRHYHEVIDELLMLYPNAKGVRFHSLGLAAPVLDYCYQKGICYDSSIYLPRQILPYKEYTGILRMPFQCADLQMVLDNDTFKLNMDQYSSKLPLCFVFHPIHVFLNTYSFEHYKKAKPYYHDFQMLKMHVNKSFPGVRDFMLDILAHADQYKFITLEKLYKQHIKTN